MTDPQAKFNEYENQVLKTKAEDVIISRYENPEVVYFHDTGLKVVAFDIPSKMKEDELVRGHMYHIAKDDFTHVNLYFQNGPIPANGVNGVTTEAVLAALIHRTEVLDALYPCEENKRGIEAMKDALQAFEDRTRNRKQRGVEGTLKV